MKIPAVPPAFLFLALMVSVPSFLHAGGGLVRPDLVTDQAATDDFSDRRLGFMVHWGPCVTIPTEIGWGIGGNRARYEAAYKPFNPAKLDLGQWADVAARAGAKYSVLVCKHHDGFCLWDTKTTPVNIMNSALHRDVVREYFDAFRKRGILPGSYLSIIDVSKQDEDHVFAAGAKPSRLPPGGIDEMVRFTGDQVDELMRDYGSTILWFDGHWLNGWDDKAAAAIYARIHKNNPKAIACRLAVTRDAHGAEVWDPVRSIGDFHSMEARHGEYLATPWETVTSVAYPNYSWSPDLKYKTPEECLKTLVRVAVGNGNLLLNFIPDPDGRIPAEQVAIADTMGDWLKKNGASIYGTRGGPWYPAAWGGSTYRGNRVFIHALPEAPARLRLAARSDTVKSAKTLDGKPVRWSRNPAGEITLDIPPELRDSVDTVVELTMENPVTEMVASKETPSIFTDPAYGKIISRDAVLILGSTSSYDRPADHAHLFDATDSPEGYAFHTGVDAAPYVTVDLGKVKTLTGVAVANRKGYESRAENLTVLLSEDGANWRRVWVSPEVRSSWDIPLTDFSDHTKTVQGEPARYLKIISHPAKPDALHLQKIRVYGVE